MADVTQNVLVDFTSNTQQLQATVDLISQSNQVSQDSVGIYKQVNAEVQKNTQLVDQNAAVTSEQQVIYDKLSRSLLSLSGASKSAVQDLLTLKPQDIAKGFDQLGISVDDYINIMEGAEKQTNSVTKSTNTLRTQLLQTRNAMAALVAQQTSGNALTQEQSTQFEQLALKAGKLSNAIQQTNLITKNLASDAPILSAFSQSVTGLAGAFQAAVGAEALFGAENKDLQATLVKVTSVTAIAQGLQQSFTLIKKEGAIATAAIVIQEKLLAAQTAITNALESESIVIRYAAIVAQKALNLAMSVNPILLLVAGLIAFLGAIYEYTQSSKAAAEQTAEFNSIIDDITTSLEAYNKGLQDSIDKQNAFLKDAGAAQSTILANTGRGIAQQIQANLDAQSRAGTELNRLNQKIFEEGGAENVKQATELGKQLLKLGDDLQKLETDQVKNGIEARRALVEEGLNKQISLAQASLSQANPAGTGQFAAQIKLANAQAALQVEQARGNNEKILAIQAELQNKIRDISLARAQFVADSEISIADKALIEAQEKARQIGDQITAEEVTRQNAADQIQLQRTLLNLKLTEDEREDLTAKTDQKIADRKRAFDKQQRLREISDDQNEQQIVLNNVELNETQKLSAKIFAIQDAAEVEIVNAKGNDAKIREIESKRENDILQAKKDAIDAAAAHELAVFNSTTAVELRGIEKQLSQQQQIQDNNEGLGGAKRAANRLGVSIQSPDQQKELVQQSAAIQASAIKIQTDALEAKFALTGEFTDKELEQYQSLQDQKTQIFEKSTADQDAIDEAFRKKQRQRTLDEVNIVGQGIVDGLNELSAFYQQQDDAANARLEAQKQRIQDELDAGNISAKEAKRRNDALIVEQKKQQFEQAKRQKTLALFQAIINTALAVTNAITTGDPYTAALRAAITGAIGAAEIAIIASKPLPQFDKGKKDAYEGLGEIAERKPELLEKDGRMYLVSKPSVVYLEAKDRVYNPVETVNMMETMTFGKTPAVIQQKQALQHMPIDYDKFGKSVANNIPQYGMDITENGMLEWIKKGNAMTKYLNRRRSLKR